MSNPKFLFGTTEFISASPGTATHGQRFHVGLGNRLTLKEPFPALPTQQGSKVAIPATRMVHGTASSLSLPLGKASREAFAPVPCGERRLRKGLDRL